MMLAITISNEIVTVGLMTGLGYALLAVGLVLVYRGSGVINFAHGELGALCAFVLAKLVMDLDWNFFAALPLVILLGAALGAIVELGVVRRLFNAPRLVLLVATIGVSQLFFLVALLLPPIQNFGAYPSPIDRSVQMGTLLLRSEHFMVLAFVPAMVASVGLFLTRTPYGIAIRASAENADAAALAGISPKRVSTVVWVLAGAIAAVTVVLLNPLRGTLVGQPSAALGPTLLLRALAAALIGRLVSLPRALIGGLAIGLVEALLFVNVGNPGAADAALFVVILVALLFTPTAGASDQGTGFTKLPRPPALPRELLGTAVERFRRPAIVLVGLGIGIAAPFVFTASDQLFLLSRMLILAIAGVGLTVLIGWSGQLSLGNFAFVGLGSVVTAGLVMRGVGFPTAVGFAVVAGIVGGVVVGAPALRLRGLLLAVTTLAFATAANSWLFALDVFGGTGTALSVPRATIFGIDLAPQRNYYYLCLAGLAIVATSFGHLRNTGIGRAIVAVRDNEQRAASLSVSPTMVKLLAFALSAGVASLAGGLLAGLRVQFGPSVFGPELSLELVGIVIIGGIGTVVGAVLGTVYVVGLPAVLGNSVEIALLTSGVGLLALLMYLPGGLLELAHRVQALGLQVLAKRIGRKEALMVPATATVTGSGSTATVGPATTREVIERPPVPDVVMSAQDIRVDLGGRTILENVSVTVNKGETLGLIGSNGAGKSTLMGAVSGFVPTVAGRVELLGQDVTGKPAHERARLGMGRIFQDARLFGDLTVRESLQVAVESRLVPELVPSLLGLPPSRRHERAVRSEADDIIGLLGLGRYADNRIATLSTGSRRIVELGCLVSQRARVLLLDEPTAGVAQREAEAFGPLVGRIATELDATVMIIEHDIPLVRSMSDRLVCMSAGKVIAEGAPDDVIRDPGVIAAYLGTDERSIARSGLQAEAT